MNAGAQMNNSAKQVNRPAQWLLLCGWLCLLLARTATATDPVWPPASQLGQIFNYTIPGNPPPTIDATNFDNESQFTINFTETTANPELFETWNTVNYTNNGLMVATSPLIEDNSGLIFGISPGCGFEFDLQTTNVNSPQMSGTFYNPGSIRVNSTNDESALGFIFSTAGLLIVSATNIINHGTVDVGLDGLIQYTGQNVDLSRSTVFLEQSSDNVNGLIGDFGTDTNMDWDPSIDLGSTYALSSLPDQIYLTASTPYINVTAAGPSNNIIRAVFVEDTSGSNVTVNVYFDSAAAFGGGNVTVEWIGSYLNWATGGTLNNYLYLNDDYVLGASTNVALTVSGIPDNFTFTESATQLIPGVAGTPGFLNIFPPGVITNRYAYTDAQIISTSASTNASLANPSGALTNLPSRIQITSMGDLNLALAQISGPNYMSVQATNQFDGSAGAQIESPYTDFNLGVTNGMMTVSNLLQAAIPNWSGTVQAWSTRWLSITNGITNDFRVMIVGSQLTATTFAQVQDLFLHGTNLLLSDNMNILRNLSIDAKSITLTTNVIAVGATSPQGSLNWQGPSTFGTPAQFPNLRWLTNNGILASANAATFGSSSASYGALINTGLITNQVSTIYASNFLSSGIISSGAGSFTLQSTTAILTNGSVAAGGNLSITTGSLLASNVVIQAGKSLTISATNLFTDNGPGIANSNIWSLGSGSVGSGFNLLVKPAAGDLRGTTITNIAPASRNVVNTWAATDFGVTSAGFTNNAAVGRLILDSLGTSPGTQFTFNGTGVSNAIYVDYLLLKDQATNRDAAGNFSALNINTNLVIYYAQAIMNGSSVAEKMNHKNNNHLRWVPSYAGYYSSTNLVYPDGSTNSFNAALAQATDIDSDGDGIDNANDPTPFFTPGQVKFKLTETNIPPLAALLTWQTMPDATNTVLYRTNLTTASWLPLTNFVTPPAPPYAPISASVLDPFNPAVQKYYRVLVTPNSTDFSGQ